jgi:predicted amidophosphoribosyltransferase
MLTHLFYFMRPFTCPGCEEASSDLICKACLRSIRKNHRMIESKTDGVLGLFPIFFSFTHTHRILRHWKLRGGKGMERLLFQPSPELIETMKTMDFEAIVAIPQDPERCLKVGHASAMEVARLFSRVLDLPILDQVLLLKSGATDKQANRSVWERRFLKNPFLGNPDESQNLPERILLVDDFITSGSTIEKAARALMTLRPDLKIHAAGLGWKPRIKPRSQDCFRSQQQFRLLGWIPSSQTASLECQSDWQSVPAPLSDRMSRSAG